jgi:hypothetical protein
MWIRGRLKIWQRGLSRRAFVASAKQPLTANFTAVGILYSGFPPTHVIY